MENKNYTELLSQSELTAVICLAHLSTTFDNIMKRNITPEEKRYLKYIRTYFYKYKDALIDRLDDRGIKRLKGKIMNYIPMLTCKSEERIMIDMKSLQDVSCEVIEMTCKDCDGTKKDCLIEKAFHDAMIPELIPSIESGRNCGYAYKVEDFND